MGFRLSLEAEEDIIGIAEAGVRMFGVAQARKYHDRLVIKASDAKGSKFFIVSVDSVKGQLSSRLMRGRSVRFSDNLEGRFYEDVARAAYHGLCSCSGSALGARTATTGRRDAGWAKIPC